MARCIPDTIPDAYTAPRLADAYRLGWNHGHGIACHNVPELGAKLWTDSLGRVTVDADNIRDVHQDACFAAADNARCYSPFEFTAKAFNDHGEGGFLICYDHGDRSETVYATREEAEEAAKAEGWEGTDIEEIPSADAMWEAFEAGTANAIMADLADYTDEDYGIESEEA